MDRIIEKYADRLDLNQEDVRMLFETCIESCYDGDEDAFMEDILDGFVITNDGKASAFAYFDYMSSTE